MTQELSGASTHEQHSNGEFGSTLRSFRDSASPLVKILSEDPKTSDFQRLREQMSFAEYLELVERNPKVTQNSYQRIYDMIMSHGVKVREENGQKVVRYGILDDTFHGGKHALFGTAMERSFAKVVDFIKSAAEGFGAEKRILLLRGPVGSAKSTIARLIKKGLEQYSKTDQGALYTFGWMPDPSKPDVVNWCPMNEEPLRLIPEDLRPRFEQHLNQGKSAKDFKVRIEGMLDPYCAREFAELYERYSGNLASVFEHVRVKRVVVSEKDRVGIGTFQPKDEKNQDSTELTGDMNYRKIAIFGSDSDPRAFNFDGEFLISNRGIIEFIEVLKLQKEFLYDLLTASQERRVKPKKFAQVEIDEMLLGHTNEPEFLKLQNDRHMEAFNDRMVVVDVPYALKVSDEMRIYERDYAHLEELKDIHVAPHTVEVAALFAVLTRLEKPKNNLSLRQKAALYNGKRIPGFTDENVVEMHKEAKREGFEGISPRFVQDAIANAAVASTPGNGINPFMVFHELEAGLLKHPLVRTDEERKRYKELIEDVKQEYAEIVKYEVMRAAAIDDDVLAALCGNYIKNVVQYCERGKVKNEITGEMMPPDERLMRSIEEKIKPPVQAGQKDDFRREIVNFIGRVTLRGETFDYASNDKLRRALEAKLIEDNKDQLNLGRMHTATIDKKTQEKFDALKARMIAKFGYNERSATDVIEYVSSIFARGDSTKS